MRRKILKWLLVSTALLLGAPAYGQDVHIMWRCGTTGFAQFCQVEAANPLPVTGTFTPSGSSPEFTPVAPATATATKGVLNGCQYDSTQKTLTDGQQSATSCSPRGAFFVATGADSFTIANTSFAATQGTSPWVVNTTQIGGVTYALGQGLMAASAPVVIASNQTAVPISQAASSVVSGAYLSGSFASGAVVDLVALSAPVAPATATATKSFLLGAQATTAAVNPTTGQQSALSSDTNNNLLVSAGGAPNVTTSQVTVTTSSTAVCPARALRRSCSVSTITGTQQVFCSGTTATAGNGQIFPAVVGASFPFQTTAAVNCIAISSSQTVSVVETF